MYTLIMVLDDSSRLDEVLQAWIDVGVRGVTILESTGVNRVLPRNRANYAFTGFAQVFGGAGVGHHTLFAVIDEVDTAESAVAATEKVLGPLNQPHTGIIFVLPVVQVWGIGD